ncbi:MAG: WYL domain-containing protein [Lachnospiraceae bacterium]|nr:WYL domain-containing protein [Lachnospiraceae bacterium]
MPKTANQKRKLFYLLSLLKEESDASHPVSMKRIVSTLESYGIHAERKSIYSDIETLRALGYDVEYQAGKPSGYYMGSREFELPELKLLVDAVQASKFVTEKQTNALIKKLEQFASRYEANALQRQVRVKNQIKSANMSTLYLIDGIHQAIHENHEISFVYCEWNLQKKLVLRRGGDRYIVSPWALLWEDENYYLVAFEPETQMIKYFRVDKMKQIRIEENKRCGKKEFEAVDLERLSRKNFGMFAGEGKRITLEFPRTLVGVAIDRFGSSVPLIPVDGDFFQILTEVNISHQFYGWLAGLGNGVRIVEPAEEAEKYYRYLKDILNNGRKK